MYNDLQIWEPPYYLSSHPVEFTARYRSISFELDRHEDLILSW